MSDDIRKALLIIMELKRKKKWVRLRTAKAILKYCTDMHEKFHDTIYPQTLFSSTCDKNTSSYWASTEFNVRRLN